MPQEPFAVQGLQHATQLSCEPEWYELRHCELESALAEADAEVYLHHCACLCVDHEVVEVSVPEAYDVPEDAADCEGFSELGA